MTTTSTTAPVELPTLHGVTPAAITADGVSIACTLHAEGGDLASRVGEWQAMLAAANGRKVY